MANRLAAGQNYLRLAAADENTNQESSDYWDKSHVFARGCFHSIEEISRDHFTAGPCAQGLEDQAIRRVTAPRRIAHNAAEEMDRPIGKGEVGAAEMSAGKIVKAPVGIGGGGGPGPGGEVANLVAPQAPMPPQGGARGGKGDKHDGPPAELQRKIKYTAILSVIVEDFAKAEKGLKAAVTEAKGFIANSEISGSTGSTRSGTCW